MAVEVVEVDVVVTDRDGRRVTGLAPEDFALLIDRKPVPIEYFTTPRGGKAVAPRAPAEASSSLAPFATAKGPAPEAPSRERLVLYIDQSALDPWVRRSALRELREFVHRAAAQGALVTVAAFESSLRLFGAPSSDPAAIEAMLAEVEKLPLSHTLAAAERIFLEREVRNLGQPTGLSTERGSGDANNLRVPFRVTEAARLEREIPLWAEQEIDHQRRSIAALRQLVTSLAALEGRKAVVFVTAGVTTEPADFLLRLLAQQRLARLSPNPRLAALSAQMAQEFEATVKDAQNAQMAFYTVAPAVAPVFQNSAEFASTGPDTVTPAPVDVAVVDRASSVVRVAAATGGQTFIVGPDLDRRLQVVEEDADAVYSLGFTTGPEAGTGDHRIEVRLGRSGLAVRHRESFRRRLPGERAEQALYAAATFGIETNPWPIALECGAATPTPGGGAGWTVPLAIRVPLRSVALLPAAGGYRGKVSFRVALQDPKGKLRVGERTVVPLRVLSADFERALDESWGHRAEMRLSPGPQRIAVLAVDELSGAYSVSTALLDVRPPASAAGRR